MSIAAVIAKTEKFRAEVTLNDEKRALRVKLLGVADETVDFESIRKYISKLESEFDCLEFDLGEITRINSVAAAQWSKMLEAVQPRRQSKFTHLSAFVMELASSFPPILGKPGIPIESFDVPFQCNTCHATLTKRFTTEEFLALPANSPMPVYPCEACHGRMEFDGLEEEHFRCIRRLQKAR
jgi:hypothetical protein